MNSLLPLPDDEVITLLREGVVIPAHPLALTKERKLDERRQRALTRYYLDAGAGGLAVAVHTTQFAIREPQHDLLRPVLELTAEVVRQWQDDLPRRIVKVAGVCGSTEQAVREAELACELGYDLALLNLSAYPDADDETLLIHAKQVAEVIPVFGFYLQPGIGGRLLSQSFFREFASIPNLIAVKMATFDRELTQGAIQGIEESGRGDEVLLYTGNDNYIVEDLTEGYLVPTDQGEKLRRMAGGLLGHWAVWTKAAVDMLEEIKTARALDDFNPSRFSHLADEVTEMNHYLFDFDHGFRGCVPGVHEVLRRQGLLEGTWCLDPEERLSEGQADALTRMSQAYPHLTDDAFVAEHLDRWLAD
ncbi:MAG: dihydrodipicolinate synthase family protein [Opitutales bacterium]